MNKLYIKGFDENLTCRGYQFEIGKTYDTGAKENLELCSNTVFHFCKSLVQVNSFYNVDNNNRFCEIEVLGDLVEDEEKCGSNKIKIVREIKGKDLDALCMRVNGNTGVFNSGYRNTGDRNSGDSNSGYRNSGDHNSGDSNSGDHNSGNWNTGMFNKSDRNTGYFNAKNHTIKIFDCDSGLTIDDVYKTTWYRVLTNYGIQLTQWVNYTDEDKENSPIRTAAGGYLKKYTFKEACLNWWKTLSDLDKQIIQEIPNFNKDIFFEITGIEL